MSKKKATARDECAGSFEESLGELEKIVAELESGKLGLLLDAEAARRLPKVGKHGDAETGTLELTR